MVEQLALADILRVSITDEIYLMLGLSPRTWIRRWLDPLVKVPTERFAEMAARFEERVSQFGFRDAAGWVLPHLVSDTRVAGVENIPSQGPLLIMSNHPGTYDALVIASSLPRDDLKIVASGIPFLESLPLTRDHLIYTKPNPHVRMGVVRTMMRHLQGGGSILLYASGGLDPDPEVMPGARQAIENWSRSIELMLRRVPMAQMVITIVSGVLDGRFVRNPLTRVRRRTKDRQRVAEFLQIIQQMVAPDRIQMIPKVTFAPPFTIDQLTPHERRDGLLKAIIRRAKVVLNGHIEMYWTIGETTDKGGENS